MNGLLVDDDELFLRTLARALGRRGLHCHCATDASRALALAREHRLDFALLDLKLGDDVGLSLIAPLREAHPALRIVLLTGYASVATAVEAIKRGADDYLPKPARVDAILKALAIASTDPVDAGARSKPLSLSPTLPEVEGMTPIQRLEWEHIQQALHETDGNISAAARLLGMHRRSLQRKLAKRPQRDFRDEG